MSFDRSEFESLLFDWESGDLNDEGIERTRELLRNYKEARKVFVEHQMLTAALGLEADAMLDPVLDESSEDELPKQLTRAPKHDTYSANKAFRVSLWAAAATALLFCGLAGRLAYLEFFQADDQLAATAEVEETSSGVALVTRMVDVKFDSDQARFEVGDALRPGSVSIKSGFAQIEFFCGATLVVEGPAEFELKSSNLARVKSGRLRAQVPPAARGFSIEVDDMKVVDLGTEFGLSVSEEGADVQVFDGEVEVFAPERTKQLLTAGQAVKRDREGKFEVAESTPNQFLDIASLKTRSDGQQAARYQKWKEHSDKLRQDSRLIAYYSFDEQGSWERKLFSSLEPDNRELDGAIVGARRVEGRWPAKSGLEFKRPGDRVRVNIPGEYGSLTFACWVRIDSLDRWYNSLFLTDNYNQGEPHWQILDTGQLFFSVRHKPDNATGESLKAPSHHVVTSAPFWKPSLSGRWLHLATTYDAINAKTTHYLNGKVIHEETIPTELHVETTRIGGASICNWSIPIKPDAEYAVRNLNGSMDEFIIFSDALGKEEIQEIYENGKP